MTDELTVISSDFCGLFLVTAIDCAAIDEGSDLIDLIPRLSMMATMSCTAGHRTSKTGAFRLVLFEFDREAWVLVYLVGIRTTKK